MNKRSLVMALGICAPAISVRLVVAQSAGEQPPDEVSNAVTESFDHLIDALGNVLPLIGTAVVVLVVFWGLATLARWVLRAAAGYIPDRTVRMLVSHVSYYFVWAIGVFVMLDALGTNFASVVTALGLGGVAVGFALKDILSNLISGILILAMRPFEIGDQIVIGETEGTVEQIELRATHIRTYDGRLVLVPNGEVFTSRVTNNTASPLRRASVQVFLGYKEDVGRALPVILDAVKSVPGVTQTPAPSIRLQELGPVSVQLDARFWADSHRANLMDTASAARVAILQALKAAGITLPDPDQRVVTVASPLPRSSDAGASGSAQAAV